MKIGLGAFFAFTVAAFVMSTCGTAVAQVPLQNQQPGNPVATSNSGPVNNLPPGSYVTITLTLTSALPNGNVIAGGLDGTIQITDSNGNVVQTFTPTPVGVGGPPPTS